MKPQFSNSSRCTVFKDMSKNWDGESNLGTTKYSTSLFFNKKDDMSKEDLQMVKYFQKWALENSITFGVTIQTVNDGSYQKAVSVTLFPNEVEGDE